ncbi:MAG TPA: nucleotidyltransferase [Pyrinomonadaceae bacterium]|nr:nucleotidyltransferase [Pyrinomonadaceae bacterium]
MLSRDFIDILSAFSEEKVEYMVVGGYAMAFHGYSRSTGDIDLWIRISNENAERVLEALKKFGGPLFDLDINDLKRPGMVFQMGIVPQRIDIITEIDSVSFDEAWIDHKVVNIEGIDVPLIGKAHLLVNKKAVARPKDQIDVLWIESEASD